MNTGRARRIRIAELTRVHGRAGLEFVITEGAVTDLRLCAPRPGRGLEQLLEGHSYEQAVELVARLSGLCPVAHQLAAVQAFETLFQIEPVPQVKSLRRTLCCGEWMRSHSLHVHLMAAPDFIGCSDAVALARNHPEVLIRGSRLQRLGEDLVALCGGRAVNPVGLCVGGLHRAPGEAEVAALCRRLKGAVEDAEALFHWCAGLEFPDDQQVFTSVALSDPHDFALEQGAIVSGSGLHLHILDLPDYLEIRESAGSTLPHTRLEDQPYLVGPLARINLNLHQLPLAVRELLQACPIAFPSHNMFHSIVARAAEICTALHEAGRLLQDYRPPACPRVELEPRGGRTVGCIEAPRGLVWHSYHLDAGGRIRKARILTPTVQNLARMEQDLTRSLEQLGAAEPESGLRLRAERVIRNYDPGFCN